MQGNIRIVCSECGTKQRVAVNFKNFNSKFDDCTHECEHCGVELLVTDPNDLPGDEMKDGAEDVY